MSGIGHNGGPTMEPGYSWRRHSWTRAREALLPKLPIEVVRRRVARAAELGLDYRAYASFRAASGHDVVALLFSSNALRLLRTEMLPEDRAAHLGAIRGAGRLSLVHPPLRPEAVTALNPVIDTAARAPGLSVSWSATSQHLRGFLAAERLPGDRVVLIGDTPLEREWIAAGKLAGYIEADRYFRA